jgi:hypothetical protein
MKNRLPILQGRRGFLRIFFVCTAGGLWALLGMLSNGAFANVRGVDIFRLVGLGMFLGGAIFSLMAYFRGRRYTED